MRVNSDETLRRAMELRSRRGVKSWLELTRDGNAQSTSLKFFTGEHPSGSTSALAGKRLTPGKN